MAQVAKPIIIYMSKKITITLLDKEMVLNFGVGRFYNLFKEATGKDLLTFSNDFDTTKLVEVTQGIVYAGYNAECKLNKTTPLFTKDEIFEAILDADTSFINEVFTKYSDSIRSNGVAPGEVVSQLSQ